MSAESPPQISYFKSTKYVADLFNVSEQSVRLWVNQGKLKAYREPPEDGNMKIPAGARRGPLWFTDEAITEWALVYHKIKE